MIAGAGAGRRERGGGGRKQVWFSSDTAKSIWTLG